MKSIFATEERQRILIECNIKFMVDDELCFIFPTETEAKKAFKALKNALAL